MNDPDSSMTRRADRTGHLDTDHVPTMAALTVSDTRPEIGARYPLQSVCADIQRHQGSAGDGLIPVFQRSGSSTEGE